MQAENNTLENNTWDSVLGAEKQAPYFQGILRFVQQERDSGKTIFPPEDEIFNAFESTRFTDTKVVILGQDPYHGPDQAHGLSFSVKHGIKTPPSLLNMYKELKQSIPEFTIPGHGNLQGWAKQGVLLLNTVLTVEQAKAHSHSKIGWETFTDKVIEQLNIYGDGIVFMLWGSHAHKKGSRIDTMRHHVLKTAHPSPLSAYRGFLGCGHFVECNKLLQQQGKHQINWQV